MYTSCFSNLSHIFFSQIIGVHFCCQLITFHVWLNCPSHHQFYLISNSLWSSEIHLKRNEQYGFSTICTSQMWVGQSSTKNLSWCECCFITWYNSAMGKADRQNWCYRTFNINKLITECSFRYSPWRTFLRKKSVFGTHFFMSAKCDNADRLDAFRVCSAKRLKTASSCCISRRFLFKLQNAVFCNI